MLILGIVVLVLAVATASPHFQKRQAGCVDAFQNVANPCGNNVLGQLYFPHPTDTSKFIQCDKFGRMYIIQCPLNFLFNPAQTMCQNVASPTTSSIPIPSNPSNPCTPSNIATGKFYFENPGDETQFIECDMLGTPNIISCPQGTIWSESQLSCIFKSTAAAAVLVPDTSAIRGLKNPCTPQNIHGNNLFFPHPDPTKFIQCDLWGDVFVNACPTNLVWNQYYKTCASPFLQAVASATGK
ncbi:hypothetical protein ACJMK2_016043 [Sinanodonta woodiana]|uniref:Chitin-binding type-2 domain-containing protein n=1 Tax=Sinanodonta woodiana TaxID=1069815 RepID=A0ABD3USC0_SINWO